MDGLASIDHGYAKFSHVRIPKESMLSKFAQVSDEGQYIQPPHAKLSYGGVSTVNIRHRYLALKEPLNRCCTYVPSELSEFSLGLVKK
jgi:hypothetical protein